MAEKKFNLKAYGIFSIVFVAVILVVLTVYTFTTRYNGFDAEKVATAYVDTIVQSGDGYNAYKNTLLSKELKFGDFIRQNYLYPVIYGDAYEIGGSTKDLKGLNDESKMGENSKNDDGTLKGQLIDNMYPVFVALIEENGGFDNYDIIFKSYVESLQTERKIIFGDDYFDDEIFFNAFESNLDKYGKSLTGAEEIVDSNTGVVTQEASTGIYQTKYGETYKLQVVSNGIKSEDGNTAVVSLNVLVNGEEVIKDIEITLVKEGSTWYVDSKKCDTSILYSFYK